MKTFEIIEVAKIPNVLVEKYIVELKPEDVRQWMLDNIDMSKKYNITMVEDFI